MPDFDIAVIGAGVAGLTAATVAAKGGARTVVIDSLGVGGQIMTVDLIENMPGFPAVSGYELGPTLQDEAAQAGVEFILGHVAAIAPEGNSFVLKGDEEISARAVIVAAGSSRRKLGVAGEDRLEGKGVSHCASCDAPIFKNRKVCVVGGGDAARSESLVLAQHAETVFLIHRGETLRAQSVLAQRVAQTRNIKLLKAGVEAIFGESVVTGVRLSTGEDLSVDGVFVYVGLIPNTAFLGELVRISKTGRIEAGTDMTTSRRGIFVAGDIREGSPALLASSAGDGETAARSTLRYLSESA
jgi:thioredoxin reductase (NADPH)